ncbi:MAG: Sec-independent protein translocase protein TatB [Geminicoccales bacterium]
MFDIGWSEMAVIMLVALVVIGPKDLPRLARNVGQWVAKGRAMAREFQRSLEDMAREAELDDVKREIEKVGRTNIKRSIEKAIDPTGDLGRAFDPTGGASSGKTPPKALGASAPNGEAKEPATARPAATSEQPAKTAKAATTKQAATSAKPKTAQPKAAAKPKATAEPKPAAKPRTSAKAKSATGTAPKTAPSETTEAETMAEPH